jgi:hypothetical protein
MNSISILILIYHKSSLSVIKSNYLIQKSLYFFWRLLFPLRSKSTGLSASTAFSPQGSKAVMAAIPVAGDGRMLRALEYLYRQLK